MKTICMKTIFMFFMALQYAVAIAEISPDTYIGHDDHGYGDRIGPDRFEVTSMNVRMDQAVMIVEIDTQFAGQANTEIGYGDVFLGTWDGQPFSSFTPYYALSIDDRSARRGTIELYQTDGATILTTDDLTAAIGGTFRNGQLAAIETTGLTPISTGKWWTEPGLISFSLSTDKINFGVGPDIYWGPTCGNDVIIGHYAINAPSTLSLILAGSLLTTVGAAHNRRRKNGKRT